MARTTPGARIFIEFPGREIPPSPGRVMDVRESPPAAFLPTGFEVTIPPSASWDAPGTLDNSSGTTTLTVSVAATPASGATYQWSVTVPSSAVPSPGGTFTLGSTGQTIDLVAGGTLSWTDGPSISLSWTSLTTTPVPTFNTLITCEVSTAGVDIPLTRTIVCQSPLPSLSITVSPNPANIIEGFTQQFTAVVTGSDDQNVTWSDSSSAYDGGSIDSGGVYHSVVDTVDGTGHTINTGGVVTATAEANPACSGTAWANPTGGYFITSEPSSAVYSTAIYHLHTNDSGVVEVWCWNAPEDTASPMGGLLGAGWVWPSQPGVDTLWCTAPGGAPAAAYTLIVNGTKVYLALYQNSSTPGAFALFSRAHPAASGDPWVTVPLPSDLGSTTNLRVMISTMSPAPDDHSTVQGSWAWGYGNLPDGIALVGVQAGTSVMSWWTPADTIAWSVGAEVYTASPAAPVLSWGDWLHEFVVLVDPSLTCGFVLDLGGATYALPTAPVTNVASPALGWASTPTLPGLFDPTKPFGFLMAPQPLSPYPTYLLWGYSGPEGVGDGPGVWLQDYGGIGSGFNAAPDVGWSSDDAPFAFAIPQDGRFLIVLSAVSTYVPGMRATTLGSGGWYSFLSISASMVDAAIGDTISVTAELNLMNGSTAMITSWDWSATDMGSSWAWLGDDGAGNATIQKLDDNGGGYTITCTVSVTEPTYGGQSWTDTASFTPPPVGSGWFGQATGVGCSYDGSWNLFTFGGVLWPNMRLSVDLTTNLLDTTSDYTGGPMPTVQLPMNWVGDPSAGSGASPGG